MIAAQARHTPVGRLVRWPLRLLPAGAVVRVLRGPARGARWVVGSATHGCWVGSYESHVQAVFAREAARARVVVDAGANAGLYTLIASRCVPEGGVVIAFEPDARNLVHLHAHVRLNRCRNVTIQPVALGDRNGEAGFTRGSHPSEGRLDPDGATRVAVRTLDAMTTSGDVPDPDLLKIDVEGGEAALLAGAQATLARSRPTIVLAIHDAAIGRACQAQLASLGYVVDTLPDGEWVARHPARRAPDAR